MTVPVFAWCVCVRVYVSQVTGQAVGRRKMRVESRLYYSCPAVHFPSLPSSTSLSVLSVLPTRLPLSSHRARLSLSADNFASFSVSPRGSSVSLPFSMTVFPLPLRTNLTVATFHQEPAIVSVFFSSAHTKYTIIHRRIET